jgi:ribosomal protein S15P/S13E
VKICCRCNIEKELQEFPKDKNRKDGYYIICKNCRKLIYQSNSKDIIEKSKKYYQDNKEKNYEKIIERNKKWRSNNPSYTTDRKKIDPTFKLIKNTRRRILRFLESKKLTKRNTTISLIGCSPHELKQHIEHKFVLGMSWENQGKWHIDHIIPLSTAKTEEEVYKLCHYSNLQPLWAKDNLAKSNKLDYLYIMDNPNI